MWRGVVAFSALALVGVGLTGCGRSLFEAREPWRTQAEEACLAQKMVPSTVYMSRMSGGISGPGACGMEHPFQVTAFAGGEIGLSRKATLACPVIPRIDGWLAEVVQPAASLYFGTAVVEVKSGSYSCRPRNNQRGARLSEHSFGNAVDVFAFRLADGREVAVKAGWRGQPEEQEFLREVFVGACGYFTTVLGPGADPFHYDHFHLDLARHDPRGERRVCKPILKFTPRLDADAATAPSRLPPQRPNTAPVPEEPLDVEEDVEDLFAVSSGPKRPAAGAPAATVRAPANAAPPLPPVAYRSAPTSTLGAPSGSAIARTPAPMPPGRPPASMASRPAAAPASQARGPVVLQPQPWSEYGIY